MSDFKLFSNIKITVLIGYFLLFALAVFGLNRIYKELVKFTESSNPLKERKELSIVSNALVSLYEAESMRKVILSEDLYNINLKSNYDAFDHKVRIYIDSLYLISKNEKIHLEIDTVNMLLDEKKKNFIGIIALMDSIRALPYSKILSTTVITHKDLDNIGSVVDNKRTEIQDTAYYIKEKRTFIERLRAVFVNRTDSTKVVTASGKTLKDTLSYTPAKLLTDTLVQFINNVNERSDRQKIAYMTKLSTRQNQMLYQDERLSEQIHTILRKIEDEEKAIIERITAEKATILKRSSKIVSGIASASILALLFFLPLTLFLIERNQRYRNKLEESNSLASKLLKSREKMLLMISHDVKAPLSSIVGHIELMLREKMPADDKDHLLSMRSSSEQILDLSNKLMDFHRIEQGKLEVNIVSFSPHKLIEDVHKAFTPIAKKKYLKLELNSQIDSEQIYESDPFVIKQILNNLINNALKFTQIGNVIISSSIDQDTNSLQVSIKDTGVGIKEEDIDKVFEEFERAGSAEDKHNIDGFGLGLAITKRLVNQLNGNIEVSSEVNKGTEFLVTIPMTLSNEIITTESTNSESEIKNKVTANLLLVDDDEALLNVYAKLLEREGINVILCYDSSLVVDKLKENEVDIIFTDIQMPRMNGFELVKKIRALGGIYTDIPIVAVSARSDINEKDFKASGFTTFISKPIPFDLLYKIICEIVENKGVNYNLHGEPDEKTTAGFYALIEYVRDDKDVSLDILNTFLEDSQSKVESMKIAADSQDWESIKSVAHKMLPLITMLGVEEIRRTLVQLESGEKDIELVNKLIPMAEQVNAEASAFIENFKEGAV